MPVIVAILTPKPGQMDALEAAFTEIIPAVHEEPGCELYALHRSGDKLVMIERWADGEALDEHMRGPVIAALGPKLEGLSGGPMEFHLLESVAAGNPNKGAI